MTEKFLTFRLRGEERIVTLWEFGRFLGLYSEEEMRNENLKYLIMHGEREKFDFNAEDYWMEINEEDDRIYGRKRVSSIKNPILQVLHKILVQYLLHRSYYEDFVLDDDL